MIPELQRPLPTFTEWLDEHGDGIRGTGFTAFVDLALRTQEQKPAHLADDEAAFLRMLQGMMVATVEVCGLEQRKHARPAELIASMLPRVFAAAAMYGVASLLREDTPWRDIAKLLTEEFRAAAKVAADQLEISFAEQKRGATENKSN